MMKTSFTQLFRRKWRWAMPMLMFLAGAQVHLYADADCGYGLSDFALVYDCEGNLSVNTPSSATSVVLIDSSANKTYNTFPIIHAGKALTAGGSFELKIFCAAGVSVFTTADDGIQLPYLEDDGAGTYSYSASGALVGPTNVPTTSAITITYTKDDPTCGPSATTMDGYTDNGSITVSFDQMLGDKCEEALITVLLSGPGGTSVDVKANETYTFENLTNGTYSLSAEVSDSGDCPCEIPSIATVTPIVLRGPDMGTTSLACNSNINKSVDQNCSATIDFWDIYRGINDPCFLAAMIDSMAVITQAGEVITGTGSEAFSRGLAGGPGLGGIVIEDASEVEVDGEIISLIGESVKVEIYSNDGNYCWGNVHIEDKAPPKLDCSNLGRRSILCLEYDGSVMNALEEGIDDCSEYTTTILAQSELSNCENLDAGVLRQIVVQYSATDVHGNASEVCQEVIDVRRFDTVPGNGFLDIPGCIIMPPSFTTHKIYTSTTTDESSGNCIRYPADRDPLDCGDEIPLREDTGTPAPIELGRGGTGSPTLRYVNPETGAVTRTPLYPINWTTAPDRYKISIAEALRSCGIGVDYEEFRFDFGCKEKIQRTWFLYEWSCPESQGGDDEQRFMLGTQEIIIADTEAPVFTSTVDDLSGTVAPDRCSLPMDIPMPTIFDSCKNDFTELQVAIYTIDAFDKWNLIGPTIGTNGRPNSSFEFPIGESYIVYTALDECMNARYDTTLVTIGDQSAPGAVCKRDLVIGISGTGIVSLHKSSIDAGTSDQCDLDRTCIVRMDHLRIFRGLDANNDGRVPFGDFDDALRASSACYRDFSDRTYVEGSVTYISDDYLCTDYAEFCCSDISTQTADGVEVEFRAYDVAGNQSACWAFVEVQDKNQAIITCPTDYINVSCELELPSYAAHYSDNANDPLGDLFGRIVEQGQQKIFGVPDEFVLDGTPSDYIDGTVFDNCGLPRISVSIATDIDGCNKGTVTRRFYSHESANDSVLVCTQVIELSGTIGLIFNDLVRNISPLVELDECISVEEARSQSFGSPITPNNVCTQALWSTEDQVFYFNQGDNSDACFKILRTFTLIDWCSDTPTTPIGTYQQVIKVSDSQDPIVTCSEDQKVSVTECTGGEVNLSASGTDQCTTGDLHMWTAVVELDTDNDGDYEQTLQLDYDEITTEQTGTLRSSASHTASYPLGSHRITWFMSDRCGNTTSCVQRFTIWNAKKPTPFAVDIATVLMQGNTPMVEVWANDLMNKDSVGPCDEMLMYRIVRASDVDADATDGGFSEAMDALTFTCADITDEGVPVNFFAFFQVGDETVFDYTTVNVRIQDNEGVCTNNTTTAFITGNIRSLSQSNIPGVEVDLMSSDLQQVSAPAMTNDAGSFAFPAMPHGGSYVVDPVSKNDDYLDGISTLDLILIQRHILGLQRLDGPYNIVAADVNGDDAVSVLDMVELRKLILGVSDQLSNSDSWRYLDAAYQFANPEYPFAGGLKEKYVIDALSTDMNIAFVGLKVGDVDNSVEIATTRSVTSLESMDQSFSQGQEVSMTLTMSEYMRLAGLQLALDFDQAQLRLVGVESTDITLAPEHIAAQDAEAGRLAISWNTQDAIELHSGQELVTVRFLAIASGQLSDAVSLATTDMSSELYSDHLDITRLQLTFGKEVAHTSYALHQNTPNPFAENTLISFHLPAASDASVTIRDLTGKVIKNYTGSFDKGNNFIQVNTNELSTTGVLYYTLRTEGYLETKRMIVLK